MVCVCEWCGYYVFWYVVVVVDFGVIVFVDDVDGFVIDYDGEFDFGI